MYLVTSKLKTFCLHYAYEVTGHVNHILTMEYYIP